MRSKNTFYKVELRPGIFLCFCLNVWNVQVIICVVIVYASLVTRQKVELRKIEKSQEIKLLRKRICGKTMPFHQSANIDDLK